ncbi:MAG: DctP family TRAP transporter solute-binding subunit [Clostridia bacterium]
MKRRVSVLLLALCLAIPLTLVGCGSKKVDKLSTPVQKEEAKKEVVKPIVLKMAHCDALTHPFTAGVKKMGEDLKKRSGGRLILEDYPASQLGSNKETTDAVVNDTLDIGQAQPAEVGRRLKKVMVFDLPYLLRDKDHIEKVLNGPIGAELWEELAEKTNIHVLGVMYYGTRHVTTGNVAVNTPDDMKGLKLRVPDNPISLAAGRGMGADPTPMSVSEVYLALQQGVVDGQENPIPTIFANKFNEVQKNLILTGHMKMTSLVFISDKKLKSLPEDLQKILKDTVADHMKIIGQTIYDMEISEIDRLRNTGEMTVIEPDLKAFEEQTYEYAYKNLESEWGAEGLKLIEKIKAVQ